MSCENEKMPEIEKRIATARAEGDLSENAEYHGARESQGMLQAKINLLKDKLARAAIMDTTKVPKDQVAFGCTIVVKDLDFGDKEEFTLVGAGEEDYDTGRSTSPARWPRASSARKSATASKSTSPPAPTNSKSSKLSSKKSEWSACATARGPGRRVHHASKALLASPRP